jgi:hypothetical protein
MAKTVVDVIELEAGEVRTQAHDWTDNLPATTAVLSVVVGATDLVTGLDGSSDAIYSNQTSSGITTISLQKLAGKDATAYDIKLTMYRNDNMIFIDHYLMPADMDRTVYALIDRALRMLGVRNLGFPLTQEEQEQGLEALNTMLLSWSSERMFVQGTVVDTFSTVPGTSSYAIGPGAVVNTSRPETIVSAYVRGNSTDFMLMPMGAEGYDSIALKSTSKIPEGYFYDGSYPTSTINLYPVPDAVYPVSIRSIKEIGSYTSVAVNHGLEGDYENSVSYNLAVHLAPKYGIQADPAIITVAAMSLNRLLNERYGKMDATLDAGLMVV